MHWGIPLATLALLLSSCEGGAADERLGYVSGGRRVEIVVSDFGGDDLIVRGDILFVRAAEAIRSGSPQALLTAVAMAETRSAGLAAQWLVRRAQPAGVDAESSTTSITLTGGTTVLQQVRDGRVQVVRAYPVPPVDSPPTTSAR